MYCWLWKGCSWDTVCLENSWLQPNKSSPLKIAHTLRTFALVAKNMLGAKLARGYEIQQLYYECFEIGVYSLCPSVELTLGWSLSTVPSALEINWWRQDIDCHPLQATGHHNNLLAERLHNLQRPYHEPYATAGTSFSIPKCGPFKWICGKIQ